jgi:hypothetical protein
MVFLRTSSQGNVLGKEKVMKKAFYVAVATLVAMSQLGCSGWGDWSTWYYVSDYGMQIAQTLRDFNVI